MKIVKAVNLKKYFVTENYEVHAVDGVTLEIEEGEFVAVVGTSGSGKTSLLNLLGGLDVPDEGGVWIRGSSLKDMESEERTIFRRRNIGFIFQQYNLIPMISVYENIVLPLRLDGAEIDQEFFEELTGTLGLKEKLGQLPETLSGGQQQRAALARAMVTNPKVLLLDEPLSAIDALLRHSLQVEIRRIQQELNMTAIFVTHDQDEAMVMSDVIHLMYNGKIEQSAAPTEMYTEPVSKFAATFIGHYNMVPVDAFKKMTGVDGEGTDVAFRPEVIDISTKPVEREGCVTIKGHVVVSLPHGNVLRYAVMCGDHQIDVDVLFKKATIIPNGTDVYLTLKQDDCIFL